MGAIEVKKNDRETFLSRLQRMEERIMQRAYNLFCESGFQDGRDLDNWLTAERDLIWKPAIELKEKDGQLEIQVDVAGMEAKDIKVEIAGEDLLVTGETKTEKEEEKDKVYTSEFQSGSLFRSIHLPKKVDPDKTKAELKNGLLTIVAPVVAEKDAQKRKVMIQAA